MTYSVGSGGRLRSQRDNSNRAALEPRAQGTEGPAVDAGAGPRPADRLGPSEVLRLQRSVGNAVLARLLAGQRSPVIQRSKESEELLTKLATPKVGEGQATGVQTELVDTLETLITTKDWRTSFNPEGDAPIDFTLGGVLIDWLPKADKTYMPSEDKQQRKGDVQGLYEQLVRYPFEAAVFVGLDKVKDDKAAKLGAKFGAEVKQAGLGPKVVENTLKTMLDAGQLEYLRLAGLPNKDWKILVEVHYVRARPKDMAGFHKDTQGESMFVNLNYHVPGEQLRGPEYVLNPPKSEAHDELIYGTANKQGSLPTEFTKDLTETRKKLPKPTTIESAGTIEGLGYVAFVDEAIHHATPWFGGRYVTPSELKAYLERNHPAQLKEIVKADKNYQAKAKSGKAEKKQGGYSQFVSEDEQFSKHVNKKKIGEGEVAKWRKLLAMASVEESKNEKYERVTRYTREDFKTTMQGKEFDLMLEDVGSHHTGADDRRKGGAAGWYAASIPKAGLSPIKPTDEQPLKRTASDRNLTKNWPKQLDENVPRKFIRSWVRAVPESFAATVRYT